MTDEPLHENERLAELRSRLQTRLLQAEPDFGGVTLEKLWRRIKRSLSDAYNDGLLETPQPLIHSSVPRPRCIEGGLFELTGGLVEGKKPFRRAPEDAVIKRSDGAWLHFTVTLECEIKGAKKGLVTRLRAYDFELVFPAGHEPRFVRFDFNEPGHENDRREQRSHIHPGHDDLMVPAPVMAPEELVDALVRRLRNTRDSAKPRA